MANIDMIDFGKLFVNYYKIKVKLNPIFFTDITCSQIPQICKVCKTNQEIWVTTPKE